MSPRKSRECLFSSGQGNRAVRLSTVSRWCWMRMCCRRELPFMQMLRQDGSQNKAGRRTKKMSKNAEAKKGFRMPHVFIILLAIMLLVVILSYLIPSGSYERIEDSATGMTVIDPDTFSYVENETPITFMDYFEAVYTGFVNGATIMGTLFISS